MGCSSCRRLAVTALLSCTLALGIAVLTEGTAEASSAGDLVREAHAHELAHEDDLAVRRYMEALSLDPTNEEAYLGLGSLRARHGDLHEAERVYSVAIEHLPGLRAARVGRAYVRRALGARAEAIDDLLNVGARGEEDPAALRILAGWYAEEGQVPAQLAVWRRIVARADVNGDATLLHEARLMVRALLVLIGPADPAASTDARDERAFRRFVATLARRGG